ncbi:hypothetical protein QBC34DRAFT_395268 [Podospora aff. communis PSN243]|uniref:Uncharacterized protein n=1 Tax=Podospora aff. communis PSN243 TaxID=3040156 RepID=A0AAV9GY72_9PEZI|nr:hypothetical protein QBC34DRAFT_395268 [Podospora aff. communis PSN243]
MESIPRGLPAELVTQILIHRYTKPASCALHDLVPEWNVCQRKNRGLEVMLRQTRVDTYVVPALGQQGVVSTTFDHGDDDHIHFPVMEDIRELDRLGPFFHRELTKAWLSDSLIQVKHQKPVLGPVWETPNYNRLLRDEKTLSLLPYEDDVHFHRMAERAGTNYSLREDADDLGEYGKDLIPLAEPLGPGETSDPYYSQVRHLMLCTPLDVWRLKFPDIVTMPISGSMTPQVQRTLNGIEISLEMERSDCFCLDWERLGKMESLFLDLRGYSWGVTVHEELLRIDDVRFLARTLGLYHRANLKLLVIAGLRSYGLYPGAQELDIETAEKGENNLSLDPQQYPEDPSAKDGMNWIQMFRGALRPGGKLILVDKRSDSLDMPMWTGGGYQS